MKPRTLTAVTVGLCLAAVPAATAHADTFNGRIAFSSFRVDPAPGKSRTGDIFSMNPDGGGLRQLTENPEDDAQTDWSPDGRDIAYRIRKPLQPTNFEVARMTAAGEDHRRLTVTPTGQASSQPSWFPDKSAILYRLSGGGATSLWRMGPFGENPAARYDPPGAQFYPSVSPDMRRVMFTTTTSSRGDTDRAIQAVDLDGTGLATLFDVVGAFDSAPAWSPDGTRIAFESDANLNGGNPERDMEIWIMDADGANPTQLTRNAIHDEGPAWSPDATMLAYSSGPENLKLDINIMTSGGVHLRQLTDHEGRDESPDWQAIPAPSTDRRCGDPADTGAGTRDVRAAGDGLSCAKALELAAGWSPGEKPGNRPARVQGFDADVSDFGGVLRVVLTHRGNRDGDAGNDKLVTFLHQP